MSVLILDRQNTPATPDSPTEKTNGAGRPPLHSGDRLSRAEFERRYADHPEIKAELIEGVVYVSSPVRSRQHSEPHSDIMGWLVMYRANTPTIRVNDNATLRIDLENELQPDACMWIETSGRTRVDADDYLAGAPELIVEVAASSASYDLHDKLRVYRRNGVQEYLVLLALEREVRWYNWQLGEDRVIVTDNDGVMRSQLFPGLWLNAERFWQGDVAGALAVLQQGLATEEHAAYAQQLAATASGKTA